MAVKKYSLTGTFKSSSGITSGYSLGEIEIDEKQMSGNSNQIQDSLISIANQKFSSRIASQGQLISVQWVSRGNVSSETKSDSQSETTSTSQFSNLWKPIWALPFKLSWIIIKWVLIGVWKAIKR